MLCGAATIFTGSKNKSIPISASVSKLIFTRDALTSVTKSLVAHVLDFFPFMTFQYRDEIKCKVYELTFLLNFINSNYDFDQSLTSATAIMLVVIRRKMTTFG